MGQPRPLFRLFSVFSNKQYNFYNKSMWKMSKFPSSIWATDSNPQPFVNESSPITTRPGLPPLQLLFSGQRFNNEIFLFSALLLCHQGQTEGRLYLRTVRQRWTPTMEPPGLHDALLRHGLLLAESLVLGKVCPQKTQPGLVQRVPQGPML